ncbi:hypothetical protein G15_0085 [Enterococcus avium]|nr:hypothetical protein G15_0085 [Enterococcus avium]
MKKFCVFKEKNIDMARLCKYYGKWYCLPHESPGNSSVCQTFEIEIGGKKTCVQHIWLSQTK